MIYFSRKTIDDIQDYINVFIIVVARYFLHLELHRYKFCRIFDFLIITHYVFFVFFLLIKVHLCELSLKTVRFVIPIACNQLEKHMTQNIISAQINAKICKIIGLKY